MACDLEFFLDFAELLIAGEAAASGNVAEHCEKDGEAERLFEWVKAEGCGDIVVEGEGDEDDDAATHDDEVAVDLFAAEGGDCQQDEADDDDDVVDEVVAGMGAEEERGEEETEEGSGESDGELAARGTEEACSFKVEEGGNGNEVVAGDAQIAKEGRVSEEYDEFNVEPESLTIEDGEEREPEEHGVELAPEKGEGESDEADGGEGCTEKEVQLAVMKDVEDLGGRSTARG